MQSPSIRLGGGPTPSAAGQMLAHYKIIKELGRGGMGTVYQGYEEALHRPVALKVLAERFTTDQQFVARFYQEAQAAAALNHPNIVQVHYIGQDQGKLFFAMEYIEGVEAADMLKQQGRLPVTDAMNIIRQTAQGLAYAARHGVIHRDIKPSNLMVTTDGTVKISDFGLAKEIDRDQRITDVGIMVGTPMYMAPEQARGEKVDHRADIYALGASFYHLIVGRPPYEAATTTGILMRHIEDPVPNAHAANKEVPLAVAGIIGRMMAKNAGDRYQNYNELLSDLDMIANQGLTTAPAAGAEGATKKVSVRRSGSGPSTPQPASTAPVGPDQKKKFAMPSLPKPVLLGGVAAIVLIAAGAWYFLGGDKTPPPPPPDPGKTPAANSGQTTNPPVTTTTPSTGTATSKTPPAANTTANSATGTPGVKPVKPVVTPANNNTATVVVPPPPPPVALVESYSLDLARAFNADVVYSPSRKQELPFAGFAAPRSTWAPNAVVPGAGLPDDGRLQLPAGTKYKGHFQFGHFSGPSAIVLSTSPVFPIAKVEFVLPLAQQQKYKSLIILHASSGGNAQSRIIAQYDNNKSQTFSLVSTDWQAAAKGSVAPSNSVVINNDVPFGVIAVDSGHKIGDAAFTAQTIASLDSTATLTKLIFSRPVITAPAPGVPFPDQDRLLVGIFAINAEPVEPAAFSASTAEETKFQSLAMDAPQLAGKNRYAEAAGIYTAIAAANPPSSFVVRRAQQEIARLKDSQSRQERLTAATRQKEIEEASQKALQVVNDYTKVFQFQGAVKKLEAEAAKVSDAEVQARLSERLADLKRVRDLHQRVIGKINQGGVMANWPLRSGGSLLQGILEKADDAGVYRGGKQIRWYDISGSSLYTIYSGATSDTQPETFLAFALLCLEQQPPWANAMELLDKAEKTDPKLAPAVNQTRARLSGGRPGENPRLSAANQLLLRATDSVSSRKWADAKKVLDEFQTVAAKPPALPAEQKTIAADLASIVNGQLEEIASARREALPLVQAAQTVAARRAEIVKNYGMIVTVRNDGTGNYKTIQEAVNSAAAKIAIEVGSGRYPEVVTIKGKSNLMIFPASDAVVVCDKINIADGSRTIVLDGLIFINDPQKEAVTIAPLAGAGDPTAIAGNIVRNCGFLGRGIKLSASSNTIIEDCVFARRGINVTSGVLTSEARRCTFTGEPILLPSSSFRLTDNLFACPGESWIFGAPLDASFASDYNFVAMGDPKKSFARVKSGANDETYKTLNDWQIKLKRDLHSRMFESAGFADPTKGDFSLLSTAPARGLGDFKASDKGGFGARWLPGHWAAYKGAFRDFGGAAPVKPGVTVTAPAAASGTAPKKEGGFLDTINKANDAKTAE